jgi:radical SAM protein with 4Fe4S-binding SPASM domain
MTAPSDLAARVDGVRGAQIGVATGLVYVVWELTLRCDQACGHCGSRAGKPRARELDTAEAIDVAAQLAGLGAKEVTLIGGEAYLRDDLPAIVRALVDRGVKCSMTSAGRSLDRAQARRLREAGIAGVSISLDGLEAAHDAQRGAPGSFRAALDALDALAAEGVPRTGNTQINRLSFPDLDAVLDLLIARGALGWQVQLTVPMGRAADRPDWLLQPWELLEVYPRLAALAERGREHGVYFWPANNVGYFGPHEATLRGRAVREDRAWGGCIAGSHALGVESDGTIKGCPSLSTEAWSAGNVREARIAELLARSERLRYVQLRAASGVRAALHGYCARCYYADVCGAGCTWTADVFFGRPGDNPYCHHRALEMRAEGKRERLVRITAPPGLPFDHGTFEIIEEPYRDEPIPRDLVELVRLRGRR